MVKRTNNFFRFVHHFVEKLSVWVLLLFSVFLTIPAFASIVRPGYFPMQDDMQAFKIFEIDNCLSDIQIPCRWSQNSGYGYGEPVFNFYSPLVYYLGEIFHLVGFQFIDSVKLVFVLGFLLSSVSAFLLVSEMFGPFTGFVGALLYTYAPFRAQQVYVRGSMAEFFAVSLLPLILFSVLKVVKSGGIKNVILFAVTLGALFLTHNLTTFIFIPVLLVWIGYWVIYKKKFDSLKNLFFGGILALGLSAFFVLPMGLEKSFVHIDSVLTGYFDYRRHFLSIEQIFFSNTWGYGSSDLGDTDNLALGSGFVVMYLGFLAFPLAIVLKKKGKGMRPLTLTLTFLEMIILFMMHLRSEFIYRFFPSLIWLQFPWRFLGVSILVLTILSGAALFLSGHFKYYLGAVAVLLVFVLHAFFFRPAGWVNITDNDKFSGELWEKQLTISIFDYLPISAELPPVNKAPDIPEVTAGNALISEFQRNSFSQSGRVSVSPEFGNGEAEIRLPLTDFPGMKVSVDNQDVNHHINCGDQKHCLGLVAFDVGPGEHIFKAQLTDTPARKAGNVITVMSFMVLVFLFVREKYAKN